MLGVVVGGTSYVRPDDGGLAFCFDIRFYLTRPEDPTDAYPGRQRTRLMVMSAGVAIK